MQKQIELGINWLISNTDNSIKTLEAKQTVESEQNKQLWLGPSAKDLLKACYKKSTIDNFVPNKYGGREGSVISTSKAANLFYGEEQGIKYLDWVIRKQDNEGYWIETDSNYYPPTKKWYFTHTRKYWMTASVIQYLAIYFNLYPYEISKALQALLVLVNDIIMRTQHQGKQYISAYLYFLNLDLWTIAHIIRTIKVCDVSQNNIVVSLLKIIKELKEEILTSNLDIMQNVCGVLIDYFPTESIFSQELLEIVINSQHREGFWSYDSLTPDITLTAYIIKLLLKSIVAY